MRAKRAARGVAGRQLWTGTHEKRQSHNSDAKRYWTSTSSDKLITKRYSLFLYPVKESHFCEPESFFRLTVSLPGQGKSFSQIAAARSHLKLCWRRLAAAEAGVAAPGAAGMPVRWPRRPAAVSEAVVAGAGPDFSCAAGQKRAAKPPNRRGKVSLGGLCVCQWVCR